jgi:hypothetical protein
MLATGAAIATGSAAVAEMANVGARGPGGQRRCQHHHRAAGASFARGEEITVNDMQGYALVTRSGLPLAARRGPCPMGGALELLNGLYPNREPKPGD